MSERSEQLRLLAPFLRPGEAERLRLGRSSPLTRKHVDQYIATLAEKYLYEKGFREKLLLPPPSPAESAGPIQIGQVWYDGSRGDFGLTKAELLRHTGLLGASGSGKTVTSLRLVQQALENDIRCIVFDVKQSYRTLLEEVPERAARIYTVDRPEISPFQFNFLVPPDGVRAELYDQKLSDIADEVLYSGLGSRSVLKSVVSSLRAQYPMPAARDDHYTMADIHREVQQVARQRMLRRSSDWTATALRVTAELASPPLGDVINVRKNDMEGEFERAKLIIFEMPLFSHYQFTYFVTAFLTREYLKRLGTERPDELDQLIVFEEAANIFKQPYPQPQFERLLREVRESGLGIMWINQSAADVNDTAFANTSTLLCMKQMNASDISKVGRAVAFDRSRDRNHLARLAVGEAIVRLPDRFRQPFLIRTRDWPKTPVSDERVAALASARAEAIREAISKSAAEFQFPGDKKEAVASIPVHQPARSTAKPSVSGMKVVQFASKQEEYEAAMAQMLARAAERPSSPVTYLYSQMGLPKAKGARVADRLVKAGLAEKTRGTVDGHAVVHLRPSAQAASWMRGREQLLSMPLVAWETQRFGGEKSKRLEEAAKRHFQAQGWKLIGTEVPDGFGSGRWDMLWVKPDGQQVVVELVTGESKAHEAIHVAKALTKGVPIVVFCASGAIRRRVERYLRDQGIQLDGEQVTLAAWEEMKNG